MIVEIYTRNWSYRPPWSGLGTHARWTVVRSSSARGLVSTFVLGWRRAPPGTPVDANRVRVYLRARYLRTWEENPPLPFCLNLDCAHLYVILCEYLLYLLFLFYSTILFVYRHFSFFILPIRISSILNSYSGNNHNRGQIPENFDFDIIFVQNYAMFSIV